MEVKESDARDLAFPDSSFDVVVSNFVAHEMKDCSGREKMMREVARVLKLGGQVALVDFIFTDDRVKDLSKFGVETQRGRDGFFLFWMSAVLNFGAVKTYHVTGKKMPGAVGALSPKPRSDESRSSRPAKATDS